ncbi:MAG: transketolase [Acidimicrobiales bacterium]
MSAPTTPQSDLDQLAISVVRGLSLDGPHRARSGHQGTALSLAPLAHVLFTRVLKYDATDPSWPDRDRFVLSPGHASILLYSMLYLTGQGLELDDLKAFRQWGSRTPGHPEAGHTAGVEVTTGPLGQGFGNAVGLALAERELRARFGSSVVDHHTFVIASDGDLSEGISHEAASWAGHLGLGRLVVVYDDNHVTIDGPTELALSDDVLERFAAYGWSTVDLGERAEDLGAMETALWEARDDEARPTLIRLRSHIAFPSPRVTDDPAAHGNPFDDAEIAATKAAMGLPDEPFHVPDPVLAHYREAGRRHTPDRIAWERRTAGLDPAVAAALATRTPVTAPYAALPRYEAGQMVATRKASQACLTAVADLVPEIIGGSADLTGNTGTLLPGGADEVQGATNHAGRQLHFGIREHAMGSTAVGAARHGGVRPVVGTFLVFSDYMRPSVRLAAMSAAPVVFVWTHDSVGVGEDGPTHQPVEQVMGLRAIPGLTVIRPADATETVGAWRMALAAEGPVALILSRQDLPVLATTDAARVVEGAYILVDNDDAEVVLVGTGSEVSLCVEAADVLAREGISARVVSMPCWETFEARPVAEQDAVIDPTLPTVSIEAGTTLGWDRYADITLGIDHFGASAPGATVLEELGMTVGAVVDAAVALVAEMDELAESAGLGPADDGQGSLNGA